MHRFVVSGVGGITSTLLVGCAGATTTPSAASTPASGAPSAASSPAPSGPTTVAMGTFHRVDADATGTVALEHMADGSFAVVFEDFKIAGADHINVILVSNADVTKTTDVDPAKIVDLGALKGTTGMQDYTVPAEMTSGAMGYHTVVLWDTAMKHAIAAAPLTMK